MRNFLKSEFGGTLLGAVTAVGVVGFVGAAMVAYYESFVRQSRMTYVRAIMTGVDDRIRMMSQQPYAYICGQERTGNADDQLEGIEGCVINEAYFASLKSVEIPGAKCAGTTACGLALNFRAPLNGHPPLDFATVTDPATGTTERKAFFPYELVYQGTDLSLRNGGYDLDNKPVGVPVPRQVLQSQVFDCGAVDPTKPVFGGFDDATGRPICRGFNTCPTGTYGTTLDFKTLRMTCVPLTTNDKKVDCSGGGQRKIARVTFADGTLSHACTELPIPPLNAAPGPANPTPNAGVCGPVNGVAAVATPTSGLCSAGSASAVAGNGPWTWSCSGQAGGTSATCSAPKQSAGGIWKGGAPGMASRACLGVIYYGKPCATLGDECYWVGPFTTYRYVCSTP